MKIAVISDIHANLHALEAVFADLYAEQVDTVYCLGDLVGYGAFPNEVVGFIHDHRIPAVLGNFDEAAAFDLHKPGCRENDVDEYWKVMENFRWTKDVLSDANRSFLQTLPMQLRFKAGSRRVLLVHGSPRRINEYLMADLPIATFEQVSRLAGCELLCVGHTHEQYHRRTGMTSIINPGSVGIPLEGTKAEYAILDLSWRLQVDFRRVDYDVESAVKALKNRNLPVPASMESTRHSQQINRSPAELYRTNKLSNEKNLSKIG